MALHPYVTITITRDSTSPKAAAFDTLLLLVNTDAFDDGELYRVYESPTDAATDLGDDTVAYAMAAAGFAQDQHPPELIVGALPTPASGKEALYRITPKSGAASVALTVIGPDGTETEVTAEEDTDNEVTTLDALVTALGAVDGITCTADSSAALVKADDLGALWRFDDFVNISGFADETPDLGYDTALTALAEAGIDFYGVVIDANSAANVAKVAAWTLTNKRIFVAGPQIVAPTDYTTTANALVTATNTRTMSLVTKAGRGNASAYPAVALAAIMRSYQPGSATYMYKALLGVKTDVWNSTDFATLKTAKCVMYIAKGGLGMTTEGWSHGGEYLDIIEGTDWIEARMSERIFDLLTSLKKIAYTDKGVALVVSEVEAQLRDAEDEAVGILEPGSSAVTSKPVKDIPTADKTARRLTGIAFSARYAGAIHYVGVAGTISV
jgi:hypothetical protein